jgi:hypothetical protein
MEIDKVTDIVDFLNAYERGTIRAALKAMSLDWRGQRKEWMKEALDEAEADPSWTVVGVGMPTPEQAAQFARDRVEWRVVNSKIQTRPVPKREPASVAQAAAAERTRPKRSDHKPKIVNEDNPAGADYFCPVCDTKLYPQPVCGKCALGKAGIRMLWVCGEDSDHAFYTE